VTVGVEVGETVLVGVLEWVWVGDREAVRVAIGVRVRVGV
jgi:hypothetical protein